VLGALPKVDKILVLGDIVGYGPDPNAVIGRLRAVRARAVMGNHDAAMLAPALLDWFNPHAAAAARWTQTVLSPGSRRYLASLPKYGRLGRHRFVHGSPRKPYLWEYILDDLQALEILVQLGRRLCFFGHTHLQGGFIWNQSRVETILRVPGYRRSFTLDIDPECAYLINPGSVGQPRDGDPRAAYAVFDSEAKQVEYYRVEYDVASAQRKIHEAGLPPILAERLSVGR